MSETLVGAHSIGHRVLLDDTELRFKEPGSNVTRVGIGIRYAYQVPLCQKADQRQRLRVIGRWKVAHFGIW
jgi:hypothetical protein